jgi:SAM-dependent methyltransferase
MSEWKKEAIKQFNGWHEKKNEFFFEKRVEKISSFIPSNPDILDVGCGDGEFLERVGRLGIAVGIDIRDNMIKRHDINMIRADAENLPFKDESFDCIVCSAVIEHIQDHDKLIEEIEQMLKPEGALILTTPNPLFSLPANYLIARYREGPDENPIDLIGIERLLSGFKFKIVHSRGFLAFPMKIPLEKLLEKLFSFKIFGRTLLLNQVVVAKKGIK